MNVSDLIGKSFERVLRWAYPSLLFAALALAGHHSTLLEFWRSTSNAVFVSVVVSLAAGAAIYMAQRYVIHDCLVKPILYWFGWTAFGNKPPKVWLVDRKVEVWAGWLCKRFGPSEKAMSDYLMSRWAYIHMMGLTAWMLLIMYYTSEAGSLSREFSPRSMWILAAAFLIGHLWETILTERMEFIHYGRSDLLTHASNEKNVHVVVCPQCGRPFSEDRVYMGHLLEQHPDRVHAYLTEKSPAFLCPGGCGTMFLSKEIAHHSVCPTDGHRVGHHLFSWAAAFFGGQ